MNVRIVRIDAPDGSAIWELERELLPGKWHRNSDGRHTNADPAILRALAEKKGWTLVSDESAER